MGSLLIPERKEIEARQHVNPPEIINIHGILQQKHVSNGTAHPTFSIETIENPKTIMNILKDYEGEGQH